MNKTRFLIAAVLALMALNAVLLAALWRRPGRPALNEGPRTIIIGLLHFDAAQTVDYDRLVEKHRADIRQKDREMAQARQAMYRLLPGDDFSKKDSLIAEVGRLQTQIEHIHFAHFQDIKKLCRAEQLADFQTLTADLEHLFGKPKRPAKQ